MKIGSVNIVRNFSSIPKSQIFSELETDLSKEIEKLHRYRFYGKNSFELNNLRKFFEDKRLIIGESLIYEGFPGRGVIRYLKCGDKENNQNERKKIFDTLFEVKPKYLFLLDDCKRSTRSKFKMSGSYEEHLKKSKVSIRDGILKYKSVIITFFEKNSAGKGYRIGKKLNSEQADILENIDPALVYFYLTQGVEIYPYDINKNNLKSIIRKLDDFLKENEEEVVCISSNSGIEKYFSEKKPSQRLYKLNCGDSFFYTIPSTPIFYSEGQGLHNGEQLVFCGDLNFGTMRYVEQKGADFESDGETIDENSEEKAVNSKKKVLDYLLNTQITNIFQDGFLGGVDKNQYDEEELKVINNIKEAFKDYLKEKTLNKARLQILKDQHVSMIYYHLAPYLFKKKITLHRSFTREQAIEEDRFFEEKSIKGKDNYYYLSSEDTMKITEKREKSAILHIMLFFRRNPGAEIVFINGEGGNFRRFLGEEIFKQKFIPRYFEFNLPSPPLKLNQIV